MERLMPRWRVDLIGKKLQQVGIIDADTAEQAVNEVAKLFRMEPVLRDKLVATRVEPSPKDRA
jgi:hypothetical protein